MESEKLTDGAFILLINAKCGKNRQQITKKFDVRWFEKPKSLSDFDRMVDYMKYVWTSEELKNFKNAKTDERRKIFNNYWHIKDPTPGTPFNELMAEYFNRVDYANTTYKELGKDGWETDRGKVHILYGPPDRADLRHFNPGAAPFEIWFYNGIGRRFTFIDNEKIGIFKLSSVD
jgi:GWxTD domain-containing protein